MMVDMYRQGDLLIIGLEPIQTELFLKSNKQSASLVVLAGSMTRHSHRLNKGVVFHLDAPDSDNVFAYLRVDEDGTELQHDEHNPIRLSRGFYSVRRQREISQGRISYVED